MKTYFRQKPANMCMGSWTRVHIRKQQKAINFNPRDPQYGTYRLTTNKYFTTRLKRVIMNITKPK